MMMSLDRFVFSLQTAPYRELQRQRNWKHRTSSRVGARDASQFTGAGDDTITLNGMVAADNDIGAVASLDELAKMGDVGDAYVLVDGVGTVYGAYIIESLNESSTYHRPDGTARKIEFNLSLKRVADETIASAQGDGKEGADSAKQVWTELKAATKVAKTVVNNVKNLSINSVKAAAIDYVVGMAPQAATAAIKGLSTASGMNLDAAVKAAKQISSLNGDSISSVVSYVLEKASGKA
ncbi:phage tail protein [Burkholderia stagnalis]|nr:phage tail protein [Burkholderia stagnalis]KVO49969.1 phage tail protein [Burkholderia stagnalis]KVP01570.1 phage tail protein [Burkholderia stagnalis]KVW93607.1 phage tail protein [Burkholderia stagnalis]KWH79438.1 phage tail protein [Burkholderia stagnalis]